MSNNRGTSWKTRPARIKFLREHPELWHAEPKAIVRALKKAGLLAATTYWMDVKIERLLADAKA